MEPQRYGPFPFTPINQRPKISWPNGAQLALWVIPNIEFVPLDAALPVAPDAPLPNVPVWAGRDYGGRVGIYRIMEVLARHNIPGTVTLNSDACTDYPQVVEACVNLGWEFMGHNQTNARWLNTIPAETERDVIFDVLDTIERFTGTRPRGWMGSALQETWHTLDYLVEAGCDFVADWINDDQPYLMDIGGRQLVSIPYSYEINGLPAFTQHSRTADEFEQMMRLQFATLYREGAESGRVMAICLHPHIIGVPHRIACLDKALEYICGHDGVWCATGSEIVDHYLSSGATF